MTAEKGTIKAYAFRLWFNFLQSDLKPILLSRQQIPKKLTTFRKQFFSKSDVKI